MSSSLTRPSHKQRFQFIDVHDYPPIFEHVRTFFEKTITPLYGDQAHALDQIYAGEDRTCEVLVVDQEEVGVIIYKDKITDEYSDLGFTKIFEIKTIVVINPEKNSGKRIASHLLYRIAKMAIAEKASGVFVTVSSEKPESLAFALNYGFKVEKLSKNHYVDGLDEFFLFHPSPERLLSKVSLELLRKQQNYITPIRKGLSEAIDFTTTDKMLLESYFQGKSRGDCIREANDYLGTRLTPLSINQTLSTLRKHNLKWQVGVSSKNYIVVFINPLFDSNEKDHKIGYVLVGIQPNGKREIFGSCLAALHQTGYWKDLFQDLRVKGIEKIDVICGPFDFKLPKSLDTIFPEVRMVYSKALKTCSAKNFFPASLGEELVEEMATLNELFMREEPPKTTKLISYTYRN